MNNKLAMSLAGDYARGKAADLALMALAVALAVFVSASAAGAATAFSAQLRALESDPSYLELRAMPSALSQQRSAAVEPLDGNPLAGFALPANGAEDALAESPSVRSTYSYSVRAFTVGEAPAGGFGGAGEFAAVTASRIPADGTTIARGATAETGPGPDDGAPPLRTEFAVGSGDLPPGLPPDAFRAQAPSAEELAEAAALEKPLVDKVSGALVDPAFLEAYGLTAAEGSLFTAEEAAANRSVLVLGSELAARLYADGKALGKRIRLDGVTYEIVGVLARTPYTAARDWNAMAFAPSRELRSGPAGTTIRFRPMDMVFQARSAAAVDAAAAELSAYFDRAAGEGTITVSSRKAELNERRDSQAVLFSAAFALSGLCVLVAVLNLMNAAATKALKRRRSLGILRAIGATAMDVTAASFWETAVSVAIGLVLGSALAFAFAPATRSVLVPNADTRGLGLAGMAAAALLAAALPLLLGTLPAWNAMRASPAELVRPE